MSIEVWLSYFLAVVILSVSPGAGAVNTMSTSIRVGVRRSIPAIFGLQAGLALDILLVGFGLGALVASSVTAFTVLKWAGAAYLVYLGYRKWTDQGTVEISRGQAGEASAWKMFNQAALVNLTNPKALVFLVALFPQFIDPARPQLMQFFILGLTLVGVDILVMFGYASLASSLRQLLSSRRHMRIQNRIFGGLFVGAGALLASVKS
ncbi:homoserine/homoserine lactone efflux protein [Desulfuromonas versatilis]|uniref:Homoserine/homoserine lactone efflux protein n=1 Tax=Desulfuromonas versatilis TaxID=2802975 RepID=A0ABN6DV17_9BACT|nr:homoserine/homoserine lactone efflux protein [Desulfuromonas versatilis]BCR03882.1 homoserine/homoserine lactone efflux protein [Desulfuromonas versatilis]